MTKLTEDNETVDTVTGDVTEGHFDPLVGHPKRNAILAVMCLSLVVIVLDNSILNVAIPRISEKLNASNRDLLWILDAYTIVFAGLLLTMGTLGDKFGRRIFLQGGLAIFGLASIVGAWAQNPGMLIAARAVMGIGGAAIMPATLSIITNVFPPKERGKAIGIWAAFAGVGVAIGPLTGGFLINHFWFGSVFLVNAPFVLGAIFANSFLVPESKDEDATKTDVFGAFLSIVGLTSLLYGIIFGADGSFTDTNVLVAFAIALVSIVTFFYWEAKVDHAMLELHFFRDKRFSSGSLSITLLFFAMFGMSFLLSQYFQDVLGFSALKSGAGFLPFAAGMIVVAPLSAKISEKLGVKSTVVLGLSLVVVALFSMTTLEVGGAYIYAMWMMLLMAVGMGLTMAPATSSIMNSLPREKAGVGSAMNDTTRMVGGALGLAIVGSIFSSKYRSALDDNEKLQGLFSQLKGTLKPVDFSKINGAIYDSISGAKVIAERQPQIASTVTDAAKHSFVSGLHRGVFAAGCAALVGVVVALVLMPQNSMTDSQHAGEMH